MPKTLQQLTPPLADKNVLEPIWMSAKKIAYHLGISYTQLVTAAEIPANLIEKNGKSIDLLSAFQWRLRVLSFSTDAKEELARAQTEKFTIEAKIKDLTYQKQVNATVDIDAVQSSLKQLLSKIKNKIEGFPARFSTQLVNIASTLEVEQILKVSSTEILLELASELRKWKIED